MNADAKPLLLVLASTYPRWRDDPEPGFVHALSRRLTDRFRVVAVVPDAPDAEPDGVLDGVEVIRYRYAPRRLQTLVNNGGIVTNLQRSRWKWLLVPGFVLGQYLAARRVMSRRKVAVIHAHWLLPQGLIARRLSRRFSVPFGVTSHGGDLFGLRGRVLTGLKRKVARSSAGMTVVSSAMCEEVARLRLDPPRVQVLPMGVDLVERFVPEAACARNPRELLFVGRLVPKKGLRHLLDAMPAIVAECPGTRLTIAGFGPEREGLEAQAARLRIADSVTFAGATPQHELPALYRRASLFVAPFVRDPSGNQEGLPVALMEAVGCGCPVVVGDVAGVRDLLGDSAEDVIVRPEDTRALATAVVVALRNPAAAAARARQLREVAADKVGWRHIAAAYGDWLEQCRTAPVGEGVGESTGGGKP